MPESSPADRRLRMLEDLAQSGKADAFGAYALALEYKSRKREDDALRVFERLRDAHPDYLPMYLMAGQMLLDSPHPERARPWLERGVEVAREQNNGKALGELEQALADAP